MKANELSCKGLMVGDWFYRPDCYDQVKEIMHAGVIGIDNMRGLITFSELEPILLTSEILEKNGVEVQEQGGGIKDVWTGFGTDCEGDIEAEFRYNIPIHLKIDGIFEGEYYTPTHIKYVHQLQHALRLCGIGKEIIL